MENRMVQLPSGYWFFMHTFGHDALGNARVTGTMFDTTLGWTQPGVWFSGPEWMEPSQIVRNGARQVLIDYFKTTPTLVTT